MEHKPISYQGANEVETHFKITKDYIQFALANYNAHETIRIDPIVEWATYYGGVSYDYGRKVSVDSLGNTYIIGNTNSSNNIASGGYQNIYGGGIYDTFLVKFNSSGVRQWTTYYGGSDLDVGNALIIDTIGDIYLAGNTKSITNIASGGHKNICGGGTDAFLVKFNSLGVRQWATYYGGSGTDAGIDLSVDGNNDIFTPVICFFKYSQVSLIFLY